MMRIKKRLSGVFCKTNGKRVFAGVMAAVLLTLTLSQAVYAAHWAEQSLNYVAAKKLLPPVYKTEQIRKDLDKEISRGDVATLLVYAIGEKATSDSINKTTFEDKAEIPAGKSNYIAAARRLAILSDELTENGRYAHANQSATRQEAAVMTAIALGMQVSEPTGFADDYRIADWAKSSVTGMKKADFFHPDANNNFVPNDLLTWGQMITVIQKSASNDKLTQPKFSVLAGSGTQGHLNGAAGKSQVSMPAGITADKSGVLYFADYGNNQIRTIKKNMTAAYAGAMGPADLYNQKLGGYADGKKDQAVFNRPMDVKPVDGGVLVADSKNNAIRLVSKDTVTTYAGSTTAGYLDGDKKSALFHTPTGIAIGENGDIYVSDTKNQVIRKIDAAGMVTTAAGIPGRPGFADGAANSALLCEPMGLAFRDGGLYIADSGNNRIRLLSDGKLATIAGGGTQTDGYSPLMVGGFADGQALNARFNMPKALAFDEKGVLYIADSENGMIRKMTNDVVSTFVGFGRPVNAKGSMLENYFINPCGILVQKDNVVVTDGFTNRILSFSTAR